MSGINFGNVGGLLGAVVGFVILAEGIRLIRSSEKQAYRKNGHKIYPLSSLHKYKKSKGIIGGSSIKFPDIKMPRFKI